MKNCLIKVYLTVVSAICVVAVCAMLGREPALPPKASIQIDDFIITLSSEQYSYKYRDIQPSAPFHFELTVEYVGEKPSVEISRGSIIGVIDIVNPNIEPKFASAIGNEKVFSTLVKNEPDIYVYTGDSHYAYLGGFSRGSYFAHAFGSFSTEDKEYTFRLNIPFVIE